MKSKLVGTIQAVVATLLHTKECCAYESSVTGGRHTARDEASIIGRKANDTAMHSTKQGLTAGGPSVTADSYILGQLETDRSYVETYGTPGTASK